MIDIKDAATRAVESPIAPPPELAHVEQLAGRYRRRRALIGATTGVTLIALTVAIGVAIVTRPGTSDVNVGPGASSTPSAPARTDSVPGPTTPAPDLTVAGLVARLTADAHHVVSEGTAPGSPLAAEAHRLCVDGVRINVYEYANPATREAVSSGISPDGYKIERPTGADGGSTVTIVDWIGRPHFFAAGQIIVLALDVDAPVLAWLTDALGPTLTPESPAGDGTQRDGCAAPSDTTP
jgi:hypothetical protein